MKIAEINTVHYGSTGKIMLQIADVARERGHEVMTFSKRWRNNSFDSAYHRYTGSFLGNVVAKVLTPVFGKDGSFSYFSTSALIKELDKFNPDIIQLHNIHGWYLNYELLFKYIKSKNVKVVWTLHDCWSFTGNCPYFTLAKCQKWETGCYACPQHKQYPETYFDNTEKMWNLKKEWFSGVEDLTIVTPSKWLGELAKMSFLKEYPVKVINNGIDLSVFKPTDSNFREKYNCENKKVLLGVAFGWGVRKGLDVFIELEKRLDPTKYQIVLVGTDDDVDKQLPDSIISIHRTQNQKELAEIYTASDLFVNPTREEVLGLVNIESNACGTPVVTYRTGGSPECIDETSGSVVDCDDVDAMEKEIIRICNENPYSIDACIARAKKFDMNARFMEYVELYEKTV